MVRQHSQLRKRTLTRIVHDYRKLNEYTVLDVTPLPRISSILKELQGKSLFSKFDIQAGYNNIRVLVEDTYKTGFKNKQRVIRMDCHAIRIMQRTSNVHENAK